MDNEFVKVPEKDKTLSPGKLFYNWFAANIGIMGFVYGAIIVSYHLSFWHFNKFIIHSNSPHFTM
ncbi:hypothetical protein GIX76_10260, partial [Lactobacillus reuteri]|nr:hypothetical protein [Limosilactobacillus reuteri]